MRRGHGSNSHDERMRMAKIDYSKVPVQRPRKIGMDPTAVPRALVIDKKPGDPCTAGQWLELRRLRKRLGLTQGRKPRTVAAAHGLIRQARAELDIDQRVGEKRRAERRRARRTETQHA
jgi:hypothetical protein